jgi:hypothetical protein
MAASELWDTLAGDIEENVVTKVAEHLAALFALQFDKAGSLYFGQSLESSSATGDEDGRYEVGPIVSTPF